MCTARPGALFSASDGMDKIMKGRDVTRHIFLFLKFITQGMDTRRVLATFATFNAKSYFLQI
jgi:hypothetical protein